MVDANMNYMTIASLVLGVLFLTWRDLSSSSNAQESPKSIPKPKMSSLAVPTLKFLYWVFEEFSQMIQQRYPLLRIEGDNYPPPPIRKTLASLLSSVKLLLIIAVVLGINPFQFLNIETPRVFQYAYDNKIYFCMMVFFLSNAIESQLISTGAFEVQYNGYPIWSKLETGRVPSPQELFQIIENQNFGIKNSNNPPTTSHN